ncbi:MAG: RNA methyltransferase [Chloroflexi bacterium]|jgi:23S rRNA (guanosine2251-2'-O)-methyltransferase|nr:RNA methyltransferase [Chloroflexota bacterium]
MSDLIFEVRVCQSCGLRYPMQKGHAFGERCPHCLGGTRVAASKTVGDEGRMNEKPAMKKNGFHAVLLDNIRSAWNVGSILRSADGFGFDHVYLCGITPTPENEAVTKTSLGAEETLPWSHHKDAVNLVSGLKREGWRVVALEEGEGAKDIRRRKHNAVEKTVLILGSEVTGVDPDLLTLSDEMLAIPMRGQKRSLNVAIAFSVAAFALV